MIDWTCKMLLPADGQF